MRYKVIIGWKCSFIFDNPYQAMNFAVNAAKYRNPEDYENEIEIRILIPEMETGEEAIDD